MAGNQNSLRKCPYHQRSSYVSLMDVRQGERDDLLIVLVANSNISKVRFDKFNWLDLVSHSNLRAPAAVICPSATQSCPPSKVPRTPKTHQRPPLRHGGLFQQRPPVSVALALQKHGTLAGAQIDKIIAELGWCPTPFSMARAANCVPVRAQATRQP